MRMDRCRKEGEIALLMRDIQRLEPVSLSVTFQVDGVAFPVRVKEIVYRNGLVILMSNIPEGGRLLSQLSTGDLNKVKKAINDAIRMASEYELHRTIADIAFICGRRKDPPEMDSQELIGNIVQWAKEFHGANLKTNWAEEDYLDAIFNFTITKYNEKK